jgi:hypothetical protein
MPPSLFPSGFLEHGTIGCDHRHQFVPGFYERLGSFVLKLSSQCVDIDAGSGATRDISIAMSLFVLRASGYATWCAVSLMDILRSPG